MFKNKKFTTIAIAGRALTRRGNLENRDCFVLFAMTLHWVVRSGTMRRRVVLATWATFSDYQVFPKAPLRLVYYAGNGELSTGISFLHPDSILEVLPLEDVIVLAETLVCRQQGKGCTLAVVMICSPYCICRMTA